MPKKHDKIDIAGSSCEKQAREQLEWHRKYQREYRKKHGEKIKEQQRASHRRNHPRRGTASQKSPEVIAEIGAALKQRPTVNMRDTMHLSPEKFAEAVNQYCKDAKL